MILKITFPVIRYNTDGYVFMEAQNEEWKGWCRAQEKELNASCSGYITQGWLQIPTQLKLAQAQSWDNTMAAATENKIPGV